MVQKIENFDIKKDARDMRDASERYQSDPISIDLRDLTL